jgi:hypothetical protein
MVKAATLDVDVNVKDMDMFTKMAGLVKELAAAAEIELTDDQLNMVDVDWNEKVSDDGKISIDGSDYITLNELRRLARLRGYISSKPRVLQVPEYENHRQTTVEWEIIWRDGTIDGAAADASWRTCNPGFRNFTVAIASNRAEARCIRAALGIDTCSLEEVGPDDEDLSGPASDQQKGAIPMLLARYKFTPEQMCDLFGDELTVKIMDGDNVNVSGLTHTEAAQMLAAINKYKPAKKKEK